MEPTNHSVSGLEVRHIPESSMEQGPDGNKVRVELPGYKVLGALVDGAFVELAKIGSARLDKRIRAAQAAAAAQTGPQSEQQ